jgi:hypothetical protein
MKKSIRKLKVFSMQFLLILEGEVISMESAEAAEYSALQKA